MRRPDNPRPTGLAVEASTTSIGTSHRHCRKQALASQLVPVSRAVAGVLRHSASEFGIAIRRDGYARVADVLGSQPVRIALDKAHVPSASAGEVLEEIVQRSESEGRPRYEFWPAFFTAGEARWIRAIERPNLQQAIQPGNPQPLGSKAAKNPGSSATVRPAFFDPLVRMIWMEEDQCGTMVVSSGFSR